jgi:molybdopterin-guanine dinucleotide biosynthesis protein A
MTRELSRSQASEIERAEIVKGARAEHPVSVRLSAPLLEALDRLAQKEHRKRGNLIQHILWEYVVLA